MIVIGVGVAIMAVSLIGSLKPKKKKTEVPKNAQPAPAAATAPAGEKNTPSPVEGKAPVSQKERAKLTWGRNPFSTLTSNKEVKKGSLILKGVSFGKVKSAYAFIDNEIVKTGDKIENYEVVKIDKDKVLLKKGGQEFYITLPE